MESADGALLDASALCVGGFEHALRNSGNMKPELPSGVDTTGHFIFRSQRKNIDGPRSRST
jgi:hypothetical protein